nr:uncharacterized protein LOC118967255 [Manis javanica]
MVTTKRLDKFQMDFGQVDKFCLWARGLEERGGIWTGRERRATHSANDGVTKRGKPFPLPTLHIPPKFKETKSKPKLAGKKPRESGAGQAETGARRGLPEGQVVLVVGGDPGGAQHGPQVQTQRQEDAHQPDQLQRGQHRHAHLLHAAARRSHARSPTAPGAQQPRRRAPEREDSLPPGSARLPPRRAAESARAAGRAGVVGSRSDAHPPCQRPLRLAPSQAAGGSAQRGGAVSGTGGLPAE